MNLTLITTGGTIDKVYGTGKGVAGLHIGDSYASPLLLRQIRTQINIFTVRSPMRMDSLDMDDDDRAAITQACRDANTRKILITHGTDTMLETAKVIADSGVARRRLIVMTGAFIPASIKGSDADFQLGLALGALFCLKTGVWIAMNGIYRYDQCYKDRKLGQFLPLK